MSCDFFSSIETMYYVIIVVFLNSLTQFTFLQLLPQLLPFGQTKTVKDFQFS